MLTGEGVRSKMPRHSLIPTYSDGTQMMPGSSGNSFLFTFVAIMLRIRSKLRV